MYGIFPQSIEVQLEHGNAGDFWCILEGVNGDLVNEGTLVTANHGQIAFQSEGSEIEFRRLTLLPAREL